MPSPTPRPTSGAPRRRAAVATLLGGLVAAASCQPQLEPAPPNPPDCPNTMPELGGTCTPGLSCHYFEPAQCTPYFTASCGPDGHWAFERPCGDPSTSGDGGGGQGGSGQGGDAGCNDKVPGPPTLVSPTQVEVPPDAVSGTVTLQFSEPLFGSLATKLTWSGPGQIVGVTKLSSTTFEVGYAGLYPGDQATLEVNGVRDACGETMTVAAAVDVEVLPSCHLFFEDFEQDFLAGGWKATDGASSGNTWNWSASAGTPNHTLGYGECATASDGLGNPSGVWNASLQTPIIDLTKVKSAVVHYESDFLDPSGKGNATLEGSTDGLTWLPLTSFGASRGPRREHVDLGPFVGKAVQLRWRYANGASADAYWDVDDVCIETYTKPDCTCPADGLEESAELAGDADANGTVEAAEATQVVLSKPGQKVTVCGTLDDAGGRDTYAFEVDASQAAGPLGAKVDLCVENAFDGAEFALLPSEGEGPVATASGLVGATSLAAQFDGSGEYFLGLAPTSASYAPARYRITVAITNVVVPLLVEGFENWPTSALTPSSDDACLTWDVTSATLSGVQPGEPPFEGANLAFFNSFDCEFGSESLVSQPLDFSGKTSATLSFAMYHDTADAQFLDSLQVEYQVGAGAWASIGPVFYRPDVVEAWRTEVVDLTPLTGKSAVRLRLKATSAYGPYLQIDDVLVVAN